MNEATLILHIPGNGSAKCIVKFKTMPVGSECLYKLTEVKKFNSDEILDHEAIDRMNPGIDERIAKKIHGEYSKSELGVDLEKKKRRWKKKRESNPDQTTLF
jgi:hypothetical protein